MCYADAGKSAIEVQSDPQIPRHSCSRGKLDVSHFISLRSMCWIYLNFLNSLKLLNSENGGVLGSEHKEATS